MCRQIAQLVAVALTPHAAGPLTARATWPAAADGHLHHWSWKLKARVLHDPLDRPPCETANSTPFLYLARQCRLSRHLGYLKCTPKMKKCRNVDAFTILDSGSRNEYEI